MMSTAYSKQTHSINVTFYPQREKKSNLTLLVTGQYTVVKDEIIGLKSGNKLCENSIYIGLSGNEETVTLTEKAPHLQATAASQMQRLLRDEADKNEYTA